MPDPRHCASCGAALVSPTRQDWKAECPRCGWFRPTNALPVVLVRARAQSGRILYTRRRDWPDGAWGLVAGFVEEGETAEAAADVDEVRLTYPDRTLTPEDWPARRLVEELLAG